jgi:hypothetical protein
MTDAINKGFENIDLEDYEDLPEQVREIANRYITAGGTYRDFIKEVAKYSDKLVREINELYVEAL